MSFPWTNLITAGSTLVAALGGASLTSLLSGRADRRRLEHERLMNRRNERTGAYAEFLGLAHADVRILRVALFRFAHGVPGDEEARTMIEEASEIVVAFNEALARVEIVGSEEAADNAKQVSEAAAQVGLRLSNSYLSGQLVESETGTAEHRELRRVVDEFAALCRRELSE